MILKETDMAGETPPASSSRLLLRVSSIPAGLWGLEKLDGVLFVIEEALDWPLVQNVAYCNGNAKEKSPCENGHEGYVHPIQQVYECSAYRRALLLPLALTLIFARWSLNAARAVLTLPPVDTQHAKSIILSWRIHLNNLYNHGSKNFRADQRAVSDRLREHPPEMNIICRTFSKWPLRLFVKKLRKILNFLGIITLPLPSERKLPMKEEEIEPKDVADAAQNWSDESSSEEVRELNDRNDPEEFRDSVIANRRVSVTVQEVILEETTECSVSSKDQLDSDAGESLQYLSSNDAEDQENTTDKERED